MDLTSHGAHPSREHLRKARSDESRGGSRTRLQRLASGLAERGEGQPCAGDPWVGRPSEKHRRSAQAHVGLRRSAHAHPTRVARPRSRSDKRPIDTTIRARQPRPCADLVESCPFADCGARGRGSGDLDAICGNRHTSVDVVGRRHRHLRPCAPLRGKPSDRNPGRRRRRRARHTRFDGSAASTHPSTGNRSAAPTPLDSLARARGTPRRRLREQLRAHPRRDRRRRDAQATRAAPSRPAQASRRSRRTPYDRGEPRATTARARLHGRRHAARSGPAPAHE